MTQEPPTVDLRAEFPRWQFSDPHVRPQWAVRTDRVTTAQIKAGCKLYLDASTRTLLRERLRVEETLLALMPQ